MKRLIASAGAFAVGAAGLQAANLTGVAQTAKFWSVSTSLRAFYDDNYLTFPQQFVGVPDTSRPGSFGFEFRPGFKLSFPGDQTTIQAGYNYSFKYYFDRDGNKSDQGHDLNAEIDHNFSPRFKVNFTDSFVSSQEPEVIEAGFVGSPVRTDASAVRNLASIKFTSVISPRIGSEAGYDNTWYNYEQEGDFSRSALLDRFEHLFHADVRWLMRPDFSPRFGYKYGLTDYTSDKLILSPDPPPTPPGDPDGVKGSERDSASHYLYVGGAYKSDRRLQFDGEVGVQATSYSTPGADNELTPYVDVSTGYVYAEGSRASLGIRHSRNATDIPGSDAENITVDQLSTGLYLNFVHRVTARITANLLMQIQHSIFTGGGDAYNGKVDKLYLIGLNFDYRIDEHWGVELGYNFDRLESDNVDRSYFRNRIYTGVRVVF